jgi:formamidopyrimidine-DNA glycosylase
LKAALSDQKVVAGLGNIYVCEALHRAHLSPKRVASTLALKLGEPHARAQALAGSIKDVLNDAIKAGGSSLRDHRQTDGDLGYFQHSFRVYDRAGTKCPTPAARARSNASCRGRDRRFIARCARSDFLLYHRRPSIQRTTARPSATTAIRPQTNPASVMTVWLTGS